MKIKQLIYSNIPVIEFLRDWAWKRDFRIFFENEIPEKIPGISGGKKTLLSLLDSIFLDDYSHYRYALLLSKHAVSRLQLQEILTDIKEELQKSGKNINDFHFLKVPSKLQETMKIGETHPLFFIVWKFEKPIMERILSGVDEEIPSPHPADNHRNTMDPFSSQETSVSGKIFRFRKMLFSSHSKITRSYVRETASGYAILFYATEKEDFSGDFYKELVEMILFGDHPLHKLEEMLQLNYLSGKNIGVLELHNEGYWRSLFYNFYSFYYRSSRKKITVLPEYKKYGRYIHLSKMEINDVLFIAPSLTDINFFEYFATSFPDFLQNLKKLHPGKVYTIKALR